MKVPIRDYEMKAYLKNPVVLWMALLGCLLCPLILLSQPVYGFVFDLTSQLSLRVRAMVPQGTSIDTIILDSQESLTWGNPFSWIFWFNLFALFGALNGGLIGAIMVWVLGRRRRRSPSK
jgi:hypothetical protein